MLPISNKKILIWLYIKVLIVNFLAPPGIEPGFKVRIIFILSFWH
jgi:hypothetical protein